MMSFWPDQHLGSKWFQDEFVGLLPLMNKYLDSMECDFETRCTVQQYLRLISSRASGLCIPCLVYQHNSTCSFPPPAFHQLSTMSFPSSAFHHQLSTSFLPLAFHHQLSTISFCPLAFLHQLSTTSSPSSAFHHQLSTTSFPP